MYIILKVLLLTILMNHFSSSELLRAPQQPQFDYAFTKFRPPPPPPPSQEPTFFQRITSWFYPWGMSREEEEFNLPASPKIDHLPSQQPPHQQYQPVISQQTIPPVHIRDTEPTTARTTKTMFTKCSPCNKVPWIPMVPTYQMPLVKGNQQNQQQQQQQQIYFKHHFNNENQYSQINSNSGYKISPPTTTLSQKYGPPVISTTLSTVYGSPPVATPSPRYGVPFTTQSPPSSSTPLKLINQGHHVYGPPSQMPIKIVQPTYKYTTPSVAFPPVTTEKPNTNTIDTSVITFTTNRPQNNRPLRFTSGLNTASAVTNPEYLPPPNLLPLEGENSPLAPIPIPNLSPTPIPPLFDAKDFNNNPYTNQQTGFIKIVPLEPVAQLSSNINVQVKPNANLSHTDNDSAVEVINSNLVADFTIAPEVVHNESESQTQTQFSQQHQKHRGGTSRINIDIENNLDNYNATLNVPIVVESAETNTDSTIAESENNFQHNINQVLDIVPFDQLKSVNGDDVINPEEDELSPNRVFPPRENVEEEANTITTTEGNYLVKFEPSIQTAADLAEEALKKSQADNYKNYNKIRDRETPLELLDSPIFHIGSTTTTTIKTTLPPFKPIEDFRKKLSTLWTAATSTTPFTTEETITTTTDTPSISTTSLSFLSRLTSGITLPRETVKPLSIGSLSTKKPKQIQIIIPYSTYHKPSPFKPQDEQEILTYRPVRGYYVTHPPRTKETSPITTTSSTSTTEITTSVITNTTTQQPLVSFEPLFNAHGYHNDQEYHENAQESKIVESKVSIDPPKPTRQLTKIVANNIRDLLKKERTPKPPRIDLIKLQRNIDGWTEQTYRGKASTMALMGHTKTIPSSFLTTTMRAKSYMKFPTTTLAPKTTFEPELMEETKRQYENILYKKDEPYVKRHDRFLDRDNELLLLNNNLTQSNYIQEGVKVYAPKTTLSPKELWKRLHVTVSPNNEKIYVVTPLPKEGSNENSTSVYKPRFAIRPTLAGIKMPKKIKPEASRRMDDSDDLIDVETINGSTKVVKIITPERKEVTSSIDSTTTEKSTHS
ncbi:hypothetical protein PVAND_013663 [Polypedilum vanderplanki]|uniref:Uncharacterized protein n=1 Tax=Polypedilum vanderplanki TaxID=319348 RepID=A0A9J6CQZ6_POLVA|nr:hypothetical protein PVAND_013663 [Polypedilum vanderplanki]